MSGLRTASEILRQADAAQSVEASSLTGLKSEAEIMADACRTYGIEQGSSDGRWDWVHRLAGMHIDELCEITAGDSLDFTGEAKAFAAVIHAREALTVRRLVLVQSHGFRIEAA